MSRDRDKAEAQLFRRVCPGRAVRAENAEGATTHPIFGRYVAVFSGFACDPDIRTAGSSGGVLTALNKWMLEARIVDQVVVTRADQGAPSRTTPVVISDPRNVLTSAGSRYAPSSTAVLFEHETGHAARTGKPCEIAAWKALRSAQGNSRTPNTDGPTLSFFCAGTPSQFATDDLIRDLGKEPSGLSSLRYRGNGWPGEFVAEDEGGPAALGYDKSWGDHLGRRLAWRCKLCADATGEAADVAVGDFWEVDAKGYPSFSEREGNSAVIARTARGAQLLRNAVEAGVLSLAPLDIDLLVPVQPLQVQRRKEILGRAIGRMLAGKIPPLYRGFPLLRAFHYHPLGPFKGLRGTYLRSKRGTHGKSETRD